jgi:hypothetical protein
LKGARRLAVQLADALAGVASGGSDPALNLLNRLADEDPALREFISARLGPAPDDFLAGFADGSSSEPADGDVSEEPEPHNDDLDHAVLMPAAPLKTLAEYVSFMKAMAQSENPLSVMARHGMTQESFVTCVSAWGDALGKDNRLALRYVELMRPETEASGSPED